MVITKQNPILYITVQRLELDRAYNFVIHLFKIIRNMDHAWNLEAFIRFTVKPILEYSSARYFCPLS